jgi:hypothetical protein
MRNQIQVLRDHPQFQDMPVKIKEWILASPHATGFLAGSSTKAESLTLVPRSPAKKR